jgi:hypothetical protein
MEDWFTVKVHYIDDNAPVEFAVVLEGELEPTGSLAIYLALMAVLCKIFNGSLLNFMSSSL